MANEEAILSLYLSLYEDNPDQNDIFCKSLLQSLAEGTKEPREAAHEMDAWVIRESTRRLKEFRARPELVKSDEFVVSRATAPNASGLVEHFFRGFPRLCAIFPPYHPGQTRVVQFLRALLRMASHDAPDSFPNADGLIIVSTMPLWPYGALHPDTFRIYGAELTGVAMRAELETPGSEASTRWRNYQSTLARITISGFSDCSFLCGLRDILPKGHGGKRAANGVRHAARGHWVPARGAVQWLMAGADEEEREQGARWVYERCRKKEKTEARNPWDTWSRENWEIWKVQLAFYEADDRVELWAREAARTALLRMKAVEAL
ncbi:uncharacterized protein PG998_012713 [Apiospora kogelbergensis]|uniref:uncharacterized protein n=1 Tax=Apiospora kogelbergensis TaxID=1337665 RepID=UPI00312F98C2